MNVQNFKYQWELAWSVNWLEKSYVSVSQPWSHIQSNICKTIWTKEKDKNIQLVRYDRRNVGNGSAFEKLSNIQPWRPCGETPFWKWPQQCACKQGHTCENMCFEGNIYIQYLSHLNIESTSVPSHIVKGRLWTISQKKALQISQGVGHHCQIPKVYLFYLLHPKIIFALCCWGTA